MRTNSIDEGQITPQAAAVFARAEKFRTMTLEPEAFTWEFIDRRANSAALREAARLGLTGIEVDKAVGGLGLGFREKVRIAEILCRSSLSFAFSLINSQNVAARLADLGTDDQRSDYLPGLLSGRRFGATALTEPHAGSDFAAIKTSAVPNSDGWILNGQKAWITNGAIADVFLCYAQTDADKGRDGIGCFLIDGRRSEFESEPAYTLTSGSAIGVSGFSLNNYEASEDDLLIRPGDGFRQALSGVNGARIYVAAMACAMVRSGLAEAVEYGSERQSFGQTLLDHQGLRWSLANVANQLEAAEALTAFAIDTYESGLTADRTLKEVAATAAHAKKFATEALEPMLRTCMQAMGAEGLRSSSRVGRLLSDARIVSYVDGTTEMQTGRISQSLAATYGEVSLESASVAYRVMTERAAEPEQDVTGDQDDGEVAPPDPGTERLDPAEEVSDSTAAAALPSFFDADPTDQLSDSGSESESESDAVDGFGENGFDGSLGAVPAAAVITAAVPPLPSSPPMPPSSSQLEDDEESPVSLTETAEALSVGFDQGSRRDDSPTSAIDSDVDEPSSSDGAPDRLVPPMPPASTAPAIPPLPPPSARVSAPSSGLFDAQSPPPSGPPLPGSGFRLDAGASENEDETASQNPQPPAPPLPPDSMRQGDS